MPNGGGDCCGTCWFNTANEGRAGYPEEPAVGAVRCSIRDLAIEVPFWTYCANHPHHNPDRIDVPIGPVYVTDDYPYTRRVLVTCPDTEPVRSTLLDLLERMEETPRAEYPGPTKLDEEVIRQVLEFREPKAAPALRRIARFDPLATPPDDNPFGRTRVGAVALAVEALAAIEGDGALDELERALRSRDPRGQPDDGSDPTALVRYHAVRGLQHCPSERANELLEIAADDPHPDVAAAARDALAARKGDA